MLKDNLANIITCIRLIGAYVLIAFEVDDPLFLIIYTICGITDVLDGFVARKLKIVSELGSKLDSVSDLSFYTIMMIKIWPYLVSGLSDVTWKLIWTVLGIRIACYVYVALRFKVLASEHTIFNKLTGFLIFIVPYIMHSKFFGTYGLLVTLFALFAALYEFYLHINKN